jgi:hypothetical protein
MQDTTITQTISNGWSHEENSEWWDKSGPLISRETSNKRYIKLQHRIVLSNTHNHSLPYVSPSGLQLQTAILSVAIVVVLLCSLMRFFLSFHRIVLLAVIVASAMSPPFMAAGQTSLTSFCPSKNQSPPKNKKRKTV